MALKKNLASKLQIPLFIEQTNNLFKFHTKMHVFTTMMEVETTNTFWINCSQIYHVHQSLHFSLHFNLLHWRVPRPHAAEINPIIISLNFINDRLLGGKICLIKLRIRRMWCRAADSYNAVKNISTLFILASSADVIISHRLEHHLMKTSLECLAEI